MSRRPLFSLFCNTFRRSPLSAVAVAGLATNEAAPGDALALEFGLALMPHPDKLVKGGEDAFFFNHSLNAFGIADGVGAWSTMGVDSAKFSRTLMRLTEGAFDSHVENRVELSPLQALRLAYDDIRTMGIQGSCTAIIGVLAHDELLLANLGDSGAMILSRDTDTKERIPRPPSLHLDIPNSLEIVFKTKDQQHQFNCPFQLGLDSSDAPEEANISRHKLKVGDLVIVGSDGLWDNLFHDDIISLAEETDDVQELAFKIASAASSRAQASVGSEASPFAIHASEAGLAFEGGKVDDITVIIAKVVPSQGRNRLSIRSHL